jgi:hypothetical protein
MTDVQEVRAASIIIHRPSMATVLSPEDIF